MDEKKVNKQWQWTFEELVRNVAGDVRIAAAQIGVEAETLRAWLPPTEDQKKHPGPPPGEMQ